MGSRTEPPALPALEPALLPPSEMSIFFCQRECNWLQALEGDIDTSHFGFLHAGSISADDIPDGSMARYALVNRAPQLHIATTEWGTMYGARRIADGHVYWRFAPFAFPFWTMPPEGDFHGVFSFGHGYPWMTLTRCLCICHRKRFHRAPASSRTAKFRLDFLWVWNSFLIPPTGMDGGDCLRINPTTIESIREVQRTRSFTGIEGRPRTGPGDYREHGRDRQSQL